MHKIDRMANIKYISTIDSNIFKMQSKIIRLPFEMKNHIYNYVDSDTKISVSLDTHKGLINKRDLFEMFTIQQLQSLYKHCVVEKISTYNKQTRKRTIKKELVELFPKAEKYRFVDEYGVDQHIYRQHPLIDILEDFKSSVVFDKKTKGTMLIRAINGFSNISSGDINIDYRFRNIAYNTILGIIYYKNRVLLKRQQSQEQRVIRQQIREHDNIIKANERQALSERKQHEQEEKQLRMIVEREERKERRLEHKLQVTQVKQIQKQEAVEKRVDKKRQEAKQRYTITKDKLERAMVKLIKKRVTNEHKLSKQREEKRQNFIRMKTKLTKALEKRDKKKVLVIPYSMKIIVG